VIMHFLNSIMGIIVISTAIYFGQTLTATKAFIAMGYIGMAVGPMRAIPHYYNRYNHFMEGMKRIEDFLNAPEVEPECLVTKGAASSKYAIKIDNQSFSWGVVKDEEKVKKQLEEEAKKIKEAEKEKESKPKKVKVESDDDQESTKSKSTESDSEGKTVSAEKEKEKEKNKQKLENVVTLKNIDFTVKKGEFVCIIGETTSGKSSILSSIIGDMLYVSPS
jgi:ATP-binding cassette subfamily C (CFTR/MRP) protein 1